MTFRRVRAASAGIALLLAACASGASPAPASNSTRVDDLTVYGAASLKGVLAAVKTAWESAHPGVTLTISTDSSATLETQIEQGAPADVFLSADTSNPKKLVDAGLAAGAPVVFAGNGLVVIVPPANPADIGSPLDLAKPGVKIIAAGDAVPITKYATQLVARLGAVAGYPADFAARYAANVVSKEDNVTAVVAKVELGEGDAGIVYVTDAKASTKVRTIAIPAAANIVAAYAGIVVKASPQVAAASAFLGWLAGPDGQAVLAGFGFQPPPP